MNYLLFSVAVYSLIDKYSLGNKLLTLDYFVPITVYTDSLSVLVSSNKCELHRAHCVFVDFSYYFRQIKVHSTISLVTIAFVKFAGGIQDF